MDIDTEVQAIRKLMLARPEIVYETSNQVGALAGLMTQCLQNKDKGIRIAVLRFIVGDVMWDIAGVKEVNSTKNLTSPAASILIELFRDPTQEKWRASDYARELIGAIEQRVTETAP